MKINEMINALRGNGDLFSEDVVNQLEELVREKDCLMAYLAQVQDENRHLREQYAELTLSIIHALTTSNERI